MANCWLFPAMYTVLLVGGKNFLPRSILDESIEESCKILDYPSITDLFPDILSDEPLVCIIEGKTLTETDLGVISVLRNTFPHIKILITFNHACRNLAAAAIHSGADAYVLEPYFMDEIQGFIRRFFKGALREFKQSTEMRMEALSLFIQGLAPEMNNRLTPVLGALQLLMGKNDSELDDMEKQENYACIYRESLRMAKILDELENFARPRKPKKNRVSLKKTVEKAIADSEKESKNSVPIENDYNAVLDKVLIDQRQVAYAITGIIHLLKENADEENGKVVVSTFTPESSHIHVVVEGFETVSIGEEANKAFIPLYLRKVIRFGHELGLSSSYGLIHSHNGDIKIKTTRTGSKFHIQIPLESVEENGKKAQSASN